MTTENNTVRISFSHQYWQAEVSIDGDKWCHKTRWKNGSSFSSSHGLSNSFDDWIRKAPLTSYTYFTWASTDIESSQYGSTVYSYLWLDFYIACAEGGFYVHDEKYSIQYVIDIIQRSVPEVRATATTISTTQRFTNTYVTGGVIWSKENCATLLTVLTCLGYTLVRPDRFSLRYSLLLVFPFASSGNVRYQPITVIVKREEWVIWMGAENGLESRSYSASFFGNCWWYLRSFVCSLLRKSRTYKLSCEEPPLYHRKVMRHITEIFEHIVPSLRDVFHMLSCTINQHFAPRN